MSRSRCPIKKDLRTPKYRKRVVSDKKAKSKREPEKQTDYNGYETDQNEWPTQSRNTSDD
jgi:hypothetical protein